MSNARVHTLRSESGSFPDFEETEYESSLLRVPITRNGEIVETLMMKALLRLHRGRPSTVLGRRQFEFKIEAWDVIAKSEAFGGIVSFKLSDTPQPKSLCRAEQEGADYPAQITYNAIYDIFINQKVVFQNVAGLGVGGDVTEIPPRGIPIAFEKPFQTGGLCVEAGMCTEMASLTPEQFDAQLQEIVALREGRISEPTTFEWPR